MRRQLFRRKEMKTSYDEYDELYQRNPHEAFQLAASDARRLRRMVQTLERAAAEVEPETLTERHKALTLGGALVTIGTQPEIKSFLHSLIHAAPDTDVKQLCEWTGMRVWPLTEYLRTLAAGSIPPETV